MKRLSTTAALESAVERRTRRKKPAKERTSEADYLSSAKALVEVSSKVRAAVAQLAGKANSTAARRNPSQAAVDAHLKELAEQLGRIEELARRLWNKK